MATLQRPMRTVAYGYTKKSGSCPSNTVILVSQQKTKVKRNVIRLLQKDNIAIGLKNEDAICPILEEYFKWDLYKDEDPYGKCDFYNSSSIEDATYGVEVKGRVDIPHRMYKTGFVDVHKVKAHLNKLYIYVFIYSDGIFYTMYNKERFDGYNINEGFTEWRDDVGRWEKSPKYEVPYTDMIPYVYLRINSLERTPCFLPL